MYASFKFQYKYIIMMNWKNTGVVVVKYLCVSIAKVTISPNNNVFFYQLISFQKNPFC